MFHALQTHTHFFFKFFCLKNIASMSHRPFYQSNVSGDPWSAPAVVHRALHVRGKRAEALRQVMECPTCGQDTSSIVGTKRKERAEGVQPDPKKLKHDDALKDATDAMMLSPGHYMPIELASVASSNHSKMMEDDDRTEQSALLESGSGSDEGSDAGSDAGSGSDDGAESGSESDEGSDADQNEKQNIDKPPAAATYVDDEAEEASEGHESDGATTEEEGSGSDDESGGDESSSGSSESESEDEGKHDDDDDEKEDAKSERSESSSGSSESESEDEGKHDEDDEKEDAKSERSELDDLLDVVKPTEAQEEEIKRVDKEDTRASDAKKKPAKKLPKNMPDIELPITPDIMKAWTKPQLVAVMRHKGLVVDGRKNISVLRVQWMQHVGEHPETLETLE
jgi:hypothetical protein